MTISRRFGRLPLGMLACAAALAAAAPAHAAGLVSSATNCGADAVSQPFLQWLDPSSYSLVPGGTFEAGAPSWGLTGGSAVSAGNESYHLNGAGDSQSLSLPDGSSATSASTCVGIQNPTIRLMVRNGGSPTSTLGVSVRFQDALGGTHTLPIALLAGGSSWEPSPVIPVVANLLPLLSGNQTSVSFQFTPHGAGGDWHVDDVYVDPWGRG